MTNYLTTFKFCSSRFVISRDYSSPVGVVVPKDWYNEFWKTDAGGGVKKFYAKSCLFFSRDFEQPLCINNCSLLIAEPV